MTFEPRTLRRLAGALVLAAGAAGAFGHESKVGDLVLAHAWSPPSLAGAKNGAAYFVAIENTGGTADRLVRASTPVAGHVELHTMAMDAQGVMRMREVDAIPVEARQKLQMQPRTGYHFMLIDLKQPLKAGDSFPMSVVFEKAGAVEVRVVVQERKAGEAPAGHTH